MSDPYTVVAGKAVAPVVKAIPWSSVWRGVRRKPPVSAHVEFNLLRQNYANPISMTYPMYLPVSEQELHKITKKDSPGIGAGLGVVELPGWAARHGGCSAHYQRIMIDIVCAKDIEVDILAFRAEAVAWEPAEGVVVRIEAGGLESSGAVKAEQVASSTTLSALQVALDARSCVVTDFDFSKAVKSRRTRLVSHDTLILDVWVGPLKFGRKDENSIKGYEWEFLVDYREVGKVGAKHTKTLRIPGKGKNRLKVFPGKIEKFKIVNGNVFPEFVDDREADQWVPARHPSGPTFPWYP